MILPIIRGHNLEDHMLGANVYPPTFIYTQTTGDVGVGVEMTPNPQYNQWMSIDQLLMGYLYSTITPENAMRAMGPSNSNQLWAIVKETYGIRNRCRITFFTSELLKTWKETMSIDRYLNTVKLLADNLEINDKTKIKQLQVHRLQIKQWREILKVQ